MFKAIRKMKCIIESSHHRCLTYSQNVMSLVSFRSFELDSCVGPAHQPTISLAHVTYRSLARHGHMIEFPTLLLMPKSGLVRHQRSLSVALLLRNRRPPLPLITAADACLRSTHSLSVVPHGAKLWAMVPVDRIGEPVRVVHSFRSLCGWMGVVMKVLSRSVPLVELRLPPSPFTMATGTATTTATATSSVKVTPQGGILAGGNPSHYDPTNPLVLFIIQVFGCCRPRLLTPNSTQVGHG